MLAKLLGRSWWVLLVRGIIAILFGVAAYQSLTIAMRTGEVIAVTPVDVVLTAPETAEIGAELTSNPIVRKLTFTGSTEVGKLLVEQCAATMKRTSMECFGSAPPTRWRCTERATRVWSRSRGRRSWMTSC